MVQSFFEFYHMGGVPSPFDRNTVYYAFHDVVDAVTFPGRRQLKFRATIGGAKTCITFKANSITISFGSYTKFIRVSRPDLYTLYHCIQEAQIVVQHDLYFASQTSQVSLLNLLSKIEDNWSSIFNAPGMKKPAIKTAGASTDLLLLLLL